MAKAETAALAPWLDHARTQIGIKEAPGSRNNPAVLQYYADVGHPEIDADEVAWCAAFTGACLKRTGYPVPPVSQNLMARSYLTYGTTVAKSDVRPGDIGIWPRGKAPFGHVAIVDDVDIGMGTVTVIGGNQRDSVSRVVSSIAGALDFRRPVAPTVTALRQAGSSEIKIGDAAQTTAAAISVAGVVASTAEAVSNAAPTVQSTTGALQTVAEHISLSERVITSATSLGEAIVRAPWIVAVFGVAISAWIIGSWIKSARVAKAAAGAPLSSQVTQEG